MPDATITVTFHCGTEATLNSLIHTIDLMTSPPSGRTDWTREIQIVRGKP